MGDNVVHALRSVSLAVMTGEFVAVMGPSGSGKATFMNLVGCLDRPSSGDFFLDGEPVEVFQGFNLLSRTTALGDVMLPMMYAGLPSKEREQVAREALKAVGLEERASHRPNELSGGQQQRVAIARAGQPTVSLLDDEPTGNLDSRTSVEVMAILQRLNSTGITILMVTHEPDIGSYRRRNVVFRDGPVLRDFAVENQRIAADELATMPTENDLVVAA